MGTALLVIFYIVLICGSIAGVISLIILIGMGNATVRANEEVAQRLKEMEDILVYVVRLQRETNQKRQNLMDLQGIGSYDQRHAPLDRDNLTQDRAEPISPTGGPTNEENWEEGL
tara:strand:+ start:3850 stop:4194 length:345 start_codon:yes stop_codon:yes gene_type:complete